MLSQLSLLPRYILLDIRQRASKLAGAQPVARMSSMVSSQTSSSGAKLNTNISGIGGWNSFIASSTRHRSLSPRDSGVFPVLSGLLCHICSLFTHRTISEGIASKGTRAHDKRAMIFHNTRVSNGSLAAYLNEDATADRRGVNPCCNFYELQYPRLVKALKYS